MVATVNIEECEKAGVCPKKAQSIANRIERAAIEAQQLGIQVFGGSGGGSLRFYDDFECPLILANMGGDWSGGDGACGPSNIDGLLRGE